MEPESVSDLLAYTKSSEVRLVCRKHRIGFRPGTQAVDLLRKIQQIPLDAVVAVVLYHEAHNVTTIEFHEASETTYV